jgi:hypothetical protein
MKKYMLLVVALLLLSALSTAQFTKEKNYIGPSIGLYFHGSTLIWGANYEYSLPTNVGPGILGIGGLIRYWSWSADGGYYAGQSWGWDYSDFMIGAQANYHFKVGDDKFDPFAGLTLAYDIGSVSYTGPSDYHYVEPSWGGLFLGIDGGCRYWFNSSWAGTVRLGFGSSSFSVIDIGADYRF